MGCRRAQPSCRGAAAGSVTPVTSSRANSQTRRTLECSNALVTTEQLSEDGARLIRRILKTERPVVFLLGSALTQPESDGAYGVASVRTIATRLRDELGDEAGIEFDDEFQRSRRDEKFGKSYQLGFERLIDEHGQDAANRVIREAVLDAYAPLSAEERLRVLAWSESHKEACNALSSNERASAWHLRKSVVALGQILASDRIKFPRVLTTNFDPLIEVATRRAEGILRRSVLDRDGNPGRHEGDGTHVVYVHGYWYGADTLHIDTQLTKTRPQLQSTLKEWIKESKIVVMGYGGWDDVLTEALAACSRDENVRPDIDWAFRGKKEPHVVKMVQPATTRAHFFEGVDMHLLLPQLRDALGLAQAGTGFGASERVKRKAWLEPPYEDLVPSPNLPAFRLLQTRYGVVPFAGRVEVVEDFTRWCEGGGLQVRLLTGKGGQGKSRLLRELCRRQTDAGWVAGLLRAPPDIGSAVAEVQAGRACLFAIDYAETWGSPLAELLTRLHRVATGARSVRVVLAARAETEWWAVLRDTAHEVVALDAPSVVVPLPSPTDDPTESWNRAVQGFQAARTIDEPRTLRTPAVAELNRWLEQGMLTFHVAALLASSGSFPDGTPTPAELFDRLLDREARLWRAKGEQHAAGVANLDRVLTKVAAIGTLVGPVAAENEARTWLRRVASLAGLTAPQLDGLARVFADLYPSREEQALAPLQPDRIGEHLVAKAITAEPALATLPFAHGAGEVAIRALRVLGRAANWHNAAMSSLILAPARVYPAALLRAWIVVAQEEQWALRMASGLEETFGALTGLTPDDSDRILQLIPLRSVALQGVALALAKRTVSEFRTATPVGEVARRSCGRRFLNLANRLSHSGLSDEALEAARRASELYQGISRGRPDILDPDLATCLNSLGVSFSVLGKLDEALEATQKAVELYERLAKQQPEAHKAELAGSLGNLGVTLAKLGKAAEGLRAVERAIELYQGLASERPDVFNPELARNLGNLGTLLAKLGKMDEALQPTKWAVEVYEGLAKKRPDAFNLDLARSLSNLGNVLCELGMTDEGLRSARQAVELYEGLAAERGAFNLDLARSLNNLGNLLRLSGQRDESLMAIERAIKLYEVLAQDHPDALAEDLAAGLNNLAGVLLEQGRLDEALGAVRRAISLCRGLAYPVFSARLPSSLCTLTIQISRSFSDIGNVERAVDAMRQAVGLLMMLARQSPQKYLRWLVDSAHQYEQLLIEAGNSTELQRVRKLIRQLLAALSLVGCEK